MHTTGSFGAFSRDDGQDVTPRGKKARALLAYLVSDPGTKIPKTVVSTLLWGDRSEAQARSSLRQALLELRTFLNRSHEIICSDRELVWIRSDTLVEEPADPTGGYKDAFQDLDGITPEFDEWLAAERSRRAKARIATLKAEAEDLIANDRADESLAVVQQMQAIDPYDEDALRLGMEAEFQRGHAGGIAELYRASAELLSTELGVQPSHETRALRDELIRRLTGAGEPARLRETDPNFFARRAREEREAAARAKTQVAREIHESLSDRYEELSASLESGKGPE